MTPTPWAQAENPLQAAVEAMYEAGAQANDGCECVLSLLACPVCRAAMLRAALPHLLRAVVEKLEAKDISWPGDTADMVVGLTYRGCKAYVDRASILSALTAAAGRIAK